MFDNMATLFGGRKILALSETGTIPDAGKLDTEKAAWSWFATWSGDFITNGVYNSTSHVSDVFNHDYVITRDELAAYSVTIPENPDVVLGTDERNAIQIRVYPNPVKQNKIIVEVPEQHRVSAIQLYNTAGKLAREVKPSRNTQSVVFDVATEAPGLYYLKIVTGQVVRIVKLVRQ
jgi:mannan endo-1,4-beta-mannosidase